LGVGELPEDVDAGAAADDGYEDVESLLKRAAAATSVGNMTGLVLRGDRSTVPLSLIVSGFMERKVLKYKMFSAAYDCAHDGILLRSMLPPQAAAAGWTEVTFWAYVMPAAVEGFWLAREDIIIAAEPFWPAALGGLMIPNMPFWQ